MCNALSIQELAKSEGIVSQLANRDIDEVSTLQSDGFGEEAPWFHTLVAEAGKI